jgi:hypothetical protein
MPVTVAPKKNALLRSPAAQGSAHCASPAKRQKGEEKSLAKETTLKV